MRSHRTKTRGVFFLVAIVGLCAAATVASGRARPPAHIVFPVVGQVQYTDDFGDVRAGHPHQGNDIVAARKAAAVAAEAGHVKYWTSSAAAGCMLYLYGRTGTMYEYIHLNNDVTMRNDNRGKCVRGTAYAIRDGARVTAGQQVGYVGDSGDANGIHPHLHFEVHPGGGRATDPYPYLQAASRLLFVSRGGAPFVLTLTGTVLSAEASRLTIRVASAQAWPSKLTQTRLDRAITLLVPAAALVQTVDAAGAMRNVAALTPATKGQKAVVWTQPAPATLKAERGDDGALSAALIQLGG
jgi:hypothetical protein